ncbi:MAG: thymidine kinase [Spirochaetes bacterium]|nr:thymidine kinase [Spirochaetota bacterium]
MSRDSDSINTSSFLKSLGFPEVAIHRSFDHFDFKKAGRRILVIGPMGSGKTEYSSRVWRDSLVAKKKSDAIESLTKTGNADRRNVFFIRSILDEERFPDYPSDALAYRGGYERCGANIASIRDSFELEKIIGGNPHIGTWIIDEATFYEERVAYIVKNGSEKNNLIFIFPSLILNFRKEIFNPTAKLLLDITTDIFPLTAYCEHPDCLKDSFYTYRYYTVGNEECPALYFDPLIIIGGDRDKDNPLEPDYCTRCDRHHYLPGKEYTFLILKPLGEKASEGDYEPLKKELSLIRNSMEKSALYMHFYEKYIEIYDPEPVMMNALKVPCIAEKALIYLFAEQNLIPAGKLKILAGELDLNTEYMEKRLTDNHRSFL